MNFMQDLTHPPKGNAMENTRIPSINEKDFNPLGDDSLEKYLDRVPRTEWVGILKALLIGFGASVLGSLTFIMGKFVQWLKGNQGSGGVKATNRSRWSSRVGERGGNLIAGIARKPEKVVRGISKGVKAVGLGTRVAMHLMKTKPPKSLGRRFHDGLASFRRFKSLTSNGY